MIATPVYWFSVSAQTKLFLDRCYPLSFFREEARPGRSAYVVESDLSGTEVGLLLAYGDRDAFRSGAVDALRTLQDGFACLGAEIVGMVYGRAELPGEIAADQVLMAKRRPSVAVWVKVDGGLSGGRPDHLRRRIVPEPPARVGLAQGAGRHCCAVPGRRINWSAGEKTRRRTSNVAMSTLRPAAAKIMAMTTN